MTDIGFVLISLVVLLPFMVVAMLINIKKQNRRQEELVQLMTRVGIEQSSQSLFLKRINEYRNSRSYHLLFGLLKKAGLHEKKSLIKLAIVQLLTFVVTAYIFITQQHLVDVKAGMFGVLLPFFPMAFVLIKLKQRQDALKKQFPEMLDAIVRALHSGLAIDGALKLISSEFKDPLGGEMEEVTKQLAVGVSMREVLKEFQSRISLQEAQFFVTTLMIQRETGGKLSNILEELSRLMRRRENFQAKVKTMTAESRFTAIFLGGAPVLYLLYKYFFDPESMNFFLSDPTGQKMLIFSLVMIFSGFVILRLMLRIRF